MKRITTILAIGILCCLALLGGCSGADAPPSQESSGEADAGTLTAPFNYESDSVAENVNIQFGPFSLEADTDYRLCIDWKDGSGEMTFLVLRGAQGEITEFFHVFLPGDEVSFTVPENDAYRIFSFNETALNDFSLSLDQDSPH